MLCDHQQTTHFSHEQKRRQSYVNEATKVIVTCYQKTIACLLLCTGLSKLLRIRKAAPLPDSISCKTSFFYFFPKKGRGKKIKNIYCQVLTRRRFLL